MTTELNLRCPICLREGLADIEPNAPKAPVIAVTEGFLIKNGTDVVCARRQVSAPTLDPIR